jgi:hypothetical protein
VHGELVDDSCKAGAKTAVCLTFQAVGDIHDETQIDDVAQRGDPAAVFAEGTEGVAVVCGKVGRADVEADFVVTEEED